MDRTGHYAGQVAPLWRRGRMLFAGEVCMNVMGLGDPVGFESSQEGRASQRKLASLSFDAAGFGHGEPIDKPGLSPMKITAWTRVLSLRQTQCSKRCFLKRANI